jgi:hypothetical protein
MATTKANHLLRDYNIWKDRPAAKGGKAKGKAKEAKPRAKKDDSDDHSIDEDTAVLHVFAMTEEDDNSGGVAFE